MGRLDRAGEGTAELALRTLCALDMRLSIGEPLSTREGERSSVDMDAIVARATPGG